MAGKNFASATIFLGGGGREVRGGWREEYIYRKSFTTFQETNMFTNFRDLFLFKFLLPSSKYEFFSRSTRSVVFFFYVERAFDMCS